MIHNVAKRNVKTEFRETWVFTPNYWEYEQLQPLFTISIPFESNGEIFSEIKVVQD